MHIKEVLIMRATLNIPDKLIEEVQRLSGQKSKTGAIVTVMEEYVRRKKMEDLVALRGKVRIDYDWKQEEEAELTAAEERERYDS
jgi:metal-responsive CopG/Arc/MetJ family transcriptional regulator